MAFFQANAALKQLLCGRVFIFDGFGVAGCLAGEITVGSKSG